MKERPILFSGAMVRAILEDRKTQTRRVVKGPIGYLGGKGGEADLSSWGWFFDGPQHHGYMVLARGMNQRHDHGCISIPCPYGEPGDRLWIQESHAFTWRNEEGDEVSVRYTADGAQRRVLLTTEEAEKLDARTSPLTRQQPGRFLYKSCSRLALEVTEVRVQRLQDISEEDAQAEGVEPQRQAGTSAIYDLPPASPSYRHGFGLLWNSINGARAGCSWADSPWVWCVSFRRVS